MIKSAEEFEWVPSAAMDHAQFASITPGTFTMGSAGGSPEERAEPRVTLSRPFRMQRTPVTQGQWLSVMRTLPGRGAGEGESYPVHSITWAEIQEFIQRLNALSSGRDFRLPTEAEWEYACRAGTVGDFGGTGVLEEMGWYQENAGGRLHPVARKAANAWGLYDMHGNVWEYVQDWHSPTYYSEMPKTDPAGPAVGLFRVVRGGAWITSRRDSRSSSRGIADPVGRSAIIGFRLVCSA